MRVCGIGELLAWVCVAFCVSRVVVWCSRMHVHAWRKGVGVGVMMGAMPPYLRARPELPPGLLPRHLAEQQEQQQQQQHCLLLQRQRPVPAPPPAHVSTGLLPPQPEAHAHASRLHTCTQVQPQSQGSPCAAWHVAVQE